MSQAQQAQGDVYRTLVAEIVRMGRVDRSIVMRTVHVGSGAALDLIDKMQEDGIISKPDRKTAERTVLITPDQLKAREHAKGVPIELDAEGRTALELLRPTIGEREEVSIDGIRTEFGIERETARDVILELARLGMTGEPDDHGTAMVLTPIGAENGRRKVAPPTPAPAPPKSAPAGIPRSIGLQPASLRGYERSTPPPSPPAPRTQKVCAWPDCTTTKIQSRGLCSHHYMASYLYWKKIGGGQRTSKPFPTPDQVIAARSEKMRPASSIRHETPKPATAPTPLPPSAPVESHALKEARAELRLAYQRIEELKGQKVALEHTVHRLEQEARTHQLGWEALARVIEQNPTLRKLLRIH